MTMNTFLYDVVISFYPFFEVLKYRCKIDIFVFARHNLFALYDITSENLQSRKLTHLATIVYLLSRITIAHRMYFIRVLRACNIFIYLVPPLSGSHLSSHLSEKLYRKRLPSTPYETKLYRNSKREKNEKVSSTIYPRESCFFSVLFAALIFPTFVLCHSAFI